MKKPTIAVLGSHSALDVCRGAKDEGFKTLVIAERGRERPYARYYKTDGGQGCVDECMVLPAFSDILTNSVQKQLHAKNVIFIPHRSFEVYLNFNYKAIETEFDVPMFGNRRLLKIEERGVSPNQYEVLAHADIRYPKQFTDLQKIDRLCLVKVLERERGFERAFFLVKDYKEYLTLTKEKLTHRIITQNQLSKAVVEEFVIGAPVNLNFFYSPLSERLELIGTDTRRQTNIEGIGKIPALYQEQVLKNIPLQYEEAGHMAVTILESMLAHVYELGERFVKTTQELYAPGIIGPFALQGIIVPGPPKKEIIIVDVSPRMPGSPGISATPYSGYLFGQSMSMGRRVAREIRQAISTKQLQKVVT